MDKSSFCWMILDRVRGSVAVTFIVEPTLFWFGVKKSWIFGWHQREKNLILFPHYTGLRALLHWYSDSGNETMKLAQLHIILKALQNRRTVTLKTNQTFKEPNSLSSLFQMVCVCLYVIVTTHIFKCISLTMKKLSFQKASFVLTLYFHSWQLLLIFSQFKVIQ